jgi:hypothetical protein
MTINFLDHTMVVKQSWNDLDLQTQIAAYSRIMTADGLTFTQKQHVLMQLLTGVTDADVENWETVVTQQIGEKRGKRYFAEILSRMYTCTDFLFTTLPTGEKAISPTLTQCPYPVLTYANIELYAPSDGLDNVQFGELATLFDLYDAHTQSDDSVIVDEILATIYRPSKPETADNVAMAYEGDRRQPLLRYEAVVEARMYLFAAMPEAAKALLLFWIGSCLAQIVKRNKALFQNDAPTYTKSYGWAGVMLKLANGVVNLDAVAVQPYQNVLTHLNMLEDERLELERQAKNS